MESTYTVACDYILWSEKFQHEFPKKQKKTDPKSLILIIKTFKFLNSLISYYYYLLLYLEGYVRSGFLVFFISIVLTILIFFSYNSLLL